MRILIKLLSIIILLFIVVVGLIYAANSGRLDRPLKHLVQYYLNVKGLNATFDGFKFKDGVLIASEVHFSLRAGVGRITNLQIQQKLSGSWNNPEFSIKIQPVELVILDENGNLLLEAEVAGEINNTNYDLAVTDIKIPNITDVNNQPLEIGKAHCKYQGNKQTIDCSAGFGKTTYLHIFSLDENAKIQVEMGNVPLMLYQLADRMFQDNWLVSFCKKFIQAGHITEGVIVLNQNGSLSEGGLAGKIKIQALDFNYNSDFPTIKNMDIDTHIEGSKFTFYVNSAYSSDILLSDGIIEMNWIGQDDTILIVRAKGKGSASSLTDFIPETQHHKMSEANIDLRPIKGDADLDIDIKIPLKPNSKNTYNITAIIQNTSLDVFKNSLNLRETKLSGLFNGDQIAINGTGNLNGFKSDLNFIYNITDDLEFSHKLDIKAYLNIEPDDPQKIGFARLLAGDSILNIKYVNKDSKGYISVDSDISKLDLYFDKLGIRKNIGDKAKLVVNGLFETPSSGKLDFSLTGEKNLSIKGDIIIEDEHTKANIIEIKHKETDLSASITEYKGKLTANLKGQKLDLSEADMMQFLGKERDSGATKIQLNIDRVRLKEDIWLDNLSLMFDCDSTRCFSGFVDAKLGSRSIEMLLTAKDETEQWLVKCSNAGALLKGIGAYNAMRSGNLTLNINTSRKQVKSGEIIPILDGSFSFERFVLHDTPTMTRVVSVVSLPGFLSMISGNKDIVFAGMTGKFSFQNNVLTIDNSAAEGPYFNFNLKGTIDTKNRMMDIEGHVNPALYGVSSIIGSIPVIGSIFTGNKNRGGLMSARYKIKDKY